MTQGHRYPYEWKLSDAQFSRSRGKAFTCFAGGGGSTMGHKLAGFDVIGCNEIDPKMNAVYVANHKPRYNFLEPIQTFKERTDLPAELYDLDILDGSPPCSSFSMAGNRSKDWGKSKKFREGQSDQVLDTLFFDFIDLAAKLQPKVVIAENVKGLLLGTAKQYVREIYKQFDAAGYYCQHWLLDASKMGVPQRRERVFFICLRKDLAGPFLHQQDMFTTVPALDMQFNEPEIIFGDVEEQNVDRKKLSPGSLKRWNGADNYGRYDKRSEGGIKFGYFYKLMRWRVCSTIMAGGTYSIEPAPVYMNDSEMCKCGSWPLDYDFTEAPGVQYVIGMSVPPVMIAQITDRVFDQWLSKLK